jgi:hypothetical protein
MELTYNGSVLWIVFCRYLQLILNRVKRWTDTVAKKKVSHLSKETDFPVVYPVASSLQPITEAVSSFHCIQELTVLQKSLEISARFKGSRLKLF